MSLAKNLVEEVSGQGKFLRKGRDQIFVENFS
jgi:hypothetical protein